MFIVSISLLYLKILATAFRVSLEAGKQNNGSDILTDCCSCVSVVHLINPEQYYYRFILY